MKKRNFSIDDHIQMGNKLRRINNELHDVAESIFKAYPKQHKATVGISNSLKQLVSIKSALEDDMFSKFSHISNDYTKVYFGPSEFIKAIPVKNEVKTTSENKGPTRMNINKIIEEAKLTEAMKYNLRLKFIESINQCGLNLDLTVNNNSNELNNWANPQTQSQFNLYICGATLNQSVIAAHHFGLIVGYVHETLDDWDEEGWGMAGEMIFYINDLYIQKFGIGFLTITEKKQEPEQEPNQEENKFTIVH